jgi:hypothetical protein
MMEEFIGCAARCHKIVMSMRGYITLGPTYTVKSIAIKFVKFMSYSPGKKKQFHGMFI